MTIIRICIPARNEERSLPVMIRSLMGQSLRTDWDLHVTILDDASTDATFDIAKGIAAEDKRVSAVRFEKNVGQSQAIAWFVKTTRADCVISMDADIRFASSQSLMALVDEILNGAELSSVRQIPLQPRTFWERGSFFSGMVQDRLAQNWRSLGNLCFCHGRGVAYGPKMQKALSSCDWPPHPIGADIYAFLVARQNGLLFQPALDATVLYRPSNSWAEYGLQMSRFRRDAEWLESRFGDLARMADATFAVLVKAAVAVAPRYPIGAVSWCVQRVLAMRQSANSNEWGFAASTKEI